MSTIDDAKEKIGKAKDFLNQDQDLKAELSALKQRNVDNLKATGLTEEVKLLLASNDQEEKNMLRALKLDHNIRAHESATGELIEREKFDMEYEGEVYTEEEIRDICIQYNLKFLKTKYYEGVISPELPSVLVRFAKKFELDIGSNGIGRDVDNFYICAPKEAFKKGKTIEDPLIFYQIKGHHGNADHYKFVHKWGNSFTPMRYLKSWKWRNAKLAYAHWTLIGMFLFAGIYSLFFNTTNMFLTYLISALISAAITGIVFGITYGQPSDDEGRGYAFTDKAWKYPKNLFNRYEWREI